MYFTQLRPSTPTETRTARVREEKEKEEKRVKEMEWYKNASYPSRLLHSAANAHHRFNFRSFILITALASLLLTVPYLLFASAHADSCMIDRTPTRMRTEEAMNLQRLEEEVGSDAPAAESIEATPATGRDRTPRLYYQHQTKIMLALLVGLVCLHTVRAITCRPPELLAAGANAVNQKTLPEGAFESGAEKHWRTTGYAAAAAAIQQWRWWHVTRVLLAYAFYLAAYFLCNGLKELLADRNCSTHGNSVSGHYLFFLYALGTNAYLFLSHRQLHTQSIFSRAFWSSFSATLRSSIVDYAFVVLYILLVFVVATILSDTYMFGYHSMRQILYGSYLSVLLFTLVTAVFEYVDPFVVSVMERNIELLRPWLLLSYDEGACTLCIRRDERPKRSHEWQPPFRMDPTDEKEVRISTLINACIHEWLFHDEWHDRFYTFPFAALFCFQLLSFGVMLLSPRPRFRDADCAAVAVCFVLLGLIYARMTRLMKKVRPFDDHKYTAKTYHYLLHLS